MRVFCGWQLIALETVEEEEDLKILLQNQVNGYIAIGETGVIGE